MRLEEVVARVLREQVAQINDDSGPASLLSWDSMRHLELINELEKVYRVRFSTAEAVAMKSVRDARQLLVRKGITL
jgi:acyl carrier protein